MHVYYAVYLLLSYTVKQALTFMVIRGILNMMDEVNDYLEYMSKNHWSKR